MKDKRVLSLQDISCVGQCSLTVALPIISACGIETAILPSAILSTHTGGFSGYTFRDLTDDIPGILNHWTREGQKFDCLYTGYLGNGSQIDLAIKIHEQLIENGGAFIVDPAMADNGSLYYGFDNDFVKQMIKLCASADYILPNITEAALLTDSEIILNNQNEEYIHNLLRRLEAIGAKNIILKGINFESDKIGIAVYETNTKKLDYYFTNKIDCNSPGTGDCFAAAFTGALIKGRTPLQSATLATDFVLECINKTINDKAHWYGVKFEKALPLLVNELNHD